MLDRWCLVIWRLARRGHILHRGALFAAALGGALALTMTVPALASANYYGVAQFQGDFHGSSLGVQSNTLTVPDLSTQFADNDNWVVNGSSAQYWVEAGLIHGAYCCTNYAAPGPALADLRLRDPARTGTVTGAIESAGGPPSSGGRGAKLAGIVTVFSRSGKKVIAREEVKKGHDFRFVLAPGSYLIKARRKLHSPGGCAAKAVHIRRSHTTRVNVYVDCGVP